MSPERSVKDVSGRSTDGETKGSKTTASVVTAKPAIRGHFKTGHREIGLRRDCFTVPDIV